MRIITLIPLPLFIVVMSAFSIALLCRSIQLYHTPNREFFGVSFIASLFGPVAIIARCVYDFCPINSIAWNISMISLAVIILIFVLLLFKIGWKRVQKGQAEKFLILLGGGFFIFGSLAFAVIIILMKFGI